MENYVSSPAEFNEVLNMLVEYRRMYRILDEKASDDRQKLLEEEADKVLGGLGIEMAKRRTDEESKDRSHPGRHHQDQG